MNSRKIEFGQFIRNRRMALKPNVTLRAFAARIYISPTYLSKIERGDFDPPAEDIIVRMAEELDCNKDYLLALSGKVSSDILKIIKNNPVQISKFLRTAKDFTNKNWDDLHIYVEEINKNNFSI